jgi:hypothetical protein
MFCGECGTQNPDTNQFCRNCGKPLRKRQQATSPPAAVPVQPVVVPPAGPVYYPQQPAGAQPIMMQQPPVPAGAAAPVTPPGKGMLVLGIASVLAGVGAFVFYPYILGALAIVLGGGSVYGTRKKAGKIAFIAIIGILIGLAAILVDNFYFVLFPPKEITFDLLSLLV